MPQQPSARERSAKFALEALLQARSRGAQNPSVIGPDVEGVSPLGLAGEVRPARDPLAHRGGLRLGDVVETLGGNPFADLLAGGILRQAQGIIRRERPSFLTSLEASLDMPTPASAIAKGASVAALGAIKNGPKLSESILKLFREAANIQRGAPEKAMTRMQHLTGGGVLNPVIEHVGDLTHRMSEAMFDQVSTEFVEPKVKGALRTLRSEYGFERELNENIHNNFEFFRETGKLGSERFPYRTEEEFREAIKKAGKRYADEHRKVPVYNRAQWMARQAAIDIGEGDYASARAWLGGLERMLDNGTFTDIASQVDPNFTDQTGLIASRLGKSEPALRHASNLAGLTDAENKVLDEIRSMMNEGRIDEAKSRASEWARSNTSRRARRRTALQSIKGMFSHRK